ncbi:ketopantoate reductase family protein [Acidocella aromatica]|uniref:2-dehydropantoate 2-reductase n=1 Tax=Acidocella aromatica TaxID=1303579 RepID=A0A840VM83_9PROT|nr:ketopantoate reductase family protein [Acidocella aromatica]MBB5373289.1 2-dehydropantoate 2-reductase [Acidocella aromatica]
MKIAIMGAGAVGCYYGALLALGGHEVTLIGRPQHVEAMNRDGLRLERAGESVFVPVQASTEAEGALDAELVLVCVKSADTEEAGRALRPVLGADALVLSLQNGVDNAERLQAALGRGVIPVVVYVGTDMAGAGHVRHHGGGRLVLGGHLALAKLFTRAGIPTEISSNVQGALWSKVILNCAYNAISAIAQMPYGRFADFPGAERVLRDVVDECLTVASRLGVTVPGDMHEVVSQLAVLMPEQRSSTAQDLARGRPTEIDYLNGYVVRQGEALSIPVPVNRTLHMLVKMLEKKN